MSERDAWARITPYELGVPGREFAESIFEAIREEVETRQVDPADPAEFLLLGQVGRAIREIQGEERGGEALQRFGAFLFHAFHFHRAGELLLFVETGALRNLLSGEGSGASEDGAAEDGAEDGAPEDGADGGEENGAAEDGADDGAPEDGAEDGAPEDGAEDRGADERGAGRNRWRGELPADAGYIQLPRHLIWSHPDPGEPAEDLDGLFWARSAGETLSLMAVFGIRSDRPGLSMVPLPPVPLADATEWAGVRARGEGEGKDFATTLPGGELDQLYSVVTAGELLKLVARVFAYLEKTPESLGAEERAPRPDGEGVDPGAPRATFLPFRRVSAVPE